MSQPLDPLHWRSSRRIVLRITHHEASLSIPESLSKWASDMKSAMIALAGIFALAGCSSDAHTPDPISISNSSSPESFGETDPVCKMSVDSSTLRTSEYSGKKFHFCSEECQKKFKAQPAFCYPQAKRRPPPAEVK